MKKIIDISNFRNAYKILNKQLEFIMDGVKPSDKEYWSLFVNLWDDNFQPEIPDSNSSIKHFWEKKIFNEDLLISDEDSNIEDKMIEDSYKEHINSDSFTKNVYSEKNLYLSIWSVFKTKYIKDTQESLIELYADENTSAEDRKILSDLLIFCNIPMVLNQVKSQMYIWGSVNFKYETIDEWDVLTEGILLLKKAILTYDNTKTGRFNIEAVDSYTENDTFNIKINTEKNRIKSVNLDFYKENFKKTDSDTILSYIINDDIISVPTSELPENFDFDKKIVFVSDFDKFINESNINIVKVSYNKIKLITYITNKLKFGIQAYLLKSSGITVAVIHDVIYNKVWYLSKMYQRISSSMIDYNELDDKINDNIQEPTYIPSNDPYYDDYYAKTDNEIKKPIIIYSNENPSLRWLAISLILNKKDFEIIKIDDKYDIFFKSEKNIKNNDNDFKINYEKLIFTDKIEKLINKNIKDIEKALSIITSLNKISFDTKLWDTDNSLTIWDTIEDEESETFEELHNRLDNDAYLNLLKKELEKTLYTNNKISDNLKYLIEVFINTLDIDEVKIESDKLKKENKGNAMFVSFKRIFWIANLAIKENIEKKYWKGSMEYMF